MGQNAERKPVWGAENIGKVIRRTPRQTQYLLESGLLPARKIGRLWVSDEDSLLQAITPGAEKSEAR
jgi:hypothetical protein